MTLPVPSTHPPSPSCNTLSISSELSAESTTQDVGEISQKPAKESISSPEASSPDLNKYVADAVLLSLPLEASGPPLKPDPVSLSSNTTSSPSFSSVTSLSSTRSETPPSSQASNTPSSLHTDIDPLASSVEKHLIKAYYGYRPPYPRKFLPQTPFSPVLKKGHINRILIYEGCFNPPHIAHLNLICYIYSRTRDSLNVVAAVIIPSSDKTCRKKFDDWNDSALLFSRQERKGMWENDPEFPEWACVIDRYWWDDLDDRLLRSAQDDGFNVKFVVACGPDYVNTERVLDYEEEVMVSDTGRAADFMTANGLLNLPGCSPWSLWPTVRPKTREEFSGKPEEYLEGYVATIEGNSDVNASQDYANDYADGLREPRNDNTVRSITIPVTDKAASPAIQYCRRNDKSEDVIFIPTDENSVYREYTSSTLIRDMMKEDSWDPKEITEQLTSLVLGPHRKPSTSLRAQRISKNLYETSIFA